MIPDLIYDVGFNNGDDTAYYLHKGFRVVAIEANPLLAARGRRRFEREIAEGRLALLDVGIAETPGLLSFWVNDDKDKWSSFDKNLGCRKGTRCHEIKVPAVRFDTVLEQHGVPYYMKVDIEGHERLCVAALDPTDLPKYASVELSDEEDIVALLHSVGYRYFKLLNQGTFTDSTPLFPNQFGLRALRKLYTHSDTIKHLVHRLPGRLRPKKEDFDNFPRGLGYDFKGGSSGPFGEETYGAWLSFQDVVKKEATIRRIHARAGGSLAECWYDVHATW